MKRFYSALFGAACVLALSSGSSSAAIVCNSDGDCWRVKKRYDYRPEFGLRAYPDSWKWSRHEHNKYRWREHREGRGYWRKGVWIDF